jgi:hypothetical protein
MHYDIANVTLAQLVERRTFNPVVVGSSPTCDTISSVTSQLVERRRRRVLRLMSSCVVMGSSPIQNNVDRVRVVPAVESCHGSSLH